MAQIYWLASLTCEGVLSVSAPRSRNKSSNISNNLIHDIMTAINLFPCANLGCNEDSRYSCSKCKLISVSLNPSIPSDHGLRGMKYCDKCCQVAHWPEHKAICKSPLMSDNWLPCSETESRRPAMARTIHHNPFGQGIYPWGNVPAIDVLNLAQNEGNDLCPDIAILFAGWVYLLSFQLRGLWLTILSIW